MHLFIPEHSMNCIGCGSEPIFVDVQELKKWLVTTGVGVECLFFKIESIVI